MTPLGDLPSRVTVYEVGPRDGLQNEAQPVGTEVKVEFVNLLSASGLATIEVTSFVRPGAVPQLADAEEVLSGIEPRDGVRFMALVPNLRGLNRALGRGLSGIALFTAASETFSRVNTNAGIAETLERFQPVIAEARRTGLWIRGYVSTAFGCPYEGEVPIASVVRVCRELDGLGVDELAISDTIGAGTPLMVERMVWAVREVVDAGRIALHFHDTRGTALANVLAGLLNGVRTFDASAGGIGGCPYAPGASGNLATEDLLYLLHGLDIETGVSLPAVARASRYLQSVTGRTPPSRYLQAALP